MTSRDSRWQNGVIAALTCLLLQVQLGAAEAQMTMPPVLTLSEAVGQALVANERSLAARDAVAQAQSGLAVARSTFLPQVVPNVFGSFGQSDVSNQTYGISLSQRFTTGTELKAVSGATSSRNQLGDFYTTDTTFLVTQPLLRGFGSVTRQPLTLARSRIEETRRQQALTEHQVALDVASAYYAIVSGEKVVGITRAAAERASRLQAQATAKLKTGRVSQLDVLRATQLVGQAEIQKLDADAALDDAMDRLRVLVGRPLDYEFSVDGQIRTDVSVQPSVDEAVAAALGRRLELVSAREARQEAALSAAALQNRSRPQVDVNLALTRREVANSLRSSFGLDKFTVATFASISMPVVRTAEEAAYRNAIIQQEQREREITATEIRVAQEARRAVRQQERASQRLALARSEVNLAQTGVEIAALRHDRGLSNNLDLIAAESDLLSARSQEVAASVDLAMASLVLRAAMGILDARTDLK